MSTTTFEVSEAYQPTGDQPQAIRELSAGLRRGDPFQTLLGVTGSGKTFTMARVIAEVGAAGAGDRPQQDAGGPALQRVPGAAAEGRGRVLRLLLRLLPARGLHRGHGHLHREGLVDQRRDRPPAPLGHGRPAGAARRGDRGVGELHLRRRARRSSTATGWCSCGWARSTRASSIFRRLVRDPLPAQRHGAGARALPGARRHARGAAGRLGDRLPHLDVRGRGGEHHRVRPAHGRGATATSSTWRSTRRPTTSRRPRRSTGRCARSARSSRSRWRGSSRPASWWRPTGCASAPSTTWR